MKTTVHCLVVAVFIGLIFTGCNNNSQETSIDAALQRPAGVEIEEQIGEPIIKFHRALRRGDYELAVSVFSNKGTFDMFNSIVGELYRTRRTLGTQEIIGEDIIFHSSIPYVYDKLGEGAKVTGSVLTTYGWQTFEFYLRNDSQDNPNITTKSWKVLYIAYPERLDEEKFNKLRK